MYGERLSERIHSQERNPFRRGSADRKRCIDSVVSHLQRILNTRQGNVPVSDEYGIPDFVDFLQTYPDSVRELEASIRNAIDKFEPRLSGTSVSFMPPDEEDLTLRFQIISFLVTEGGRPVLLETVVDSDGRVRVRW